MKTLTLFSIAAIASAPFALADHHGADAFKKHPAADDSSFTTIFDGKDMSKIDTEGNWKIQDDGSLHLEPHGFEDELLIRALADAVAQFSRFQECESVSLTTVHPKQLSTVLRRALTALA